MLRLYLGCALIDAPDDFLEKIVAFRTKLRDTFEVLDFVNPGTGTSTEVYRNDIHKQIANCHLMIAVCDYASNGLGYEMATMIEKHGKPVLAVAHKNSRVSRLILGIDNSCFEFARYDNIDEAYVLLKDFAQRRFQE